MIIQIALGGWLAANYAAPHCAGLPLCGPGSLSRFSFFDVFHLPLAESTYEYGVLSADSRMSIHLLHRIWALVTSTVILFTLYKLWSHCYSRKIKDCVLTVFIALIAQLSLGVLLILWQFPISVALAHNLVAAFLLLSVVRLCYYVKSRC